MAKSKETKLTTAEILAELEQKYGLKKASMNDLTIVSTGSMQLDQAMEIGGTALGKMYELLGEESSGKAQPLSSKILTPKGWKSMGEIEIGSIISTPDGGNSTIIGVYPQGEQDIYRITFDDKTYTYCTLDHLWYVNSRRPNTGEILSVKEMLDRGIKSLHGTRKFRIPTCNPIKFEQYKEISVDPYLLGVLLGDGGFTDSCVKVTICEKDILNEVTNILIKDYDDVILSGPFSKCNYSFRKKRRVRGCTKLWYQLDDLELLGKYSYEKHIPKQYMYTSVENRIALLQGLMDTDGSGDGNGFSFSTMSHQLSKDLEELVRSLGFRCSTSSRFTKYNSSTGEKVDGRLSYRSSFLINTHVCMPFRLERKIKASTGIKGEYSERYIEKIEYTGRENCQCIMIGHPDQLYITDNYIVTHNTTVSLHQLAEYQKAFPDKKVALFDYEHSFNIDLAKSVGLNTEELLFYQPDTLEEGYDMILALIGKGIVSCVVIDSQTSAAPKAVLEGEMEDSTIGLQARLNSKFCQKVRGIMSINKCSLFFVSQTRNTIGGFGDPNITTGGKAIKFYSDARWKLWKTNDKINGLIKVTIDIIKSKLGTPFGQAKADIVCGKGFDREGEIVDYGLEFKLIQRNGSWFSYGDIKLGQGREAAKGLLKDNPELMEELTLKVRDALRGIVKPTVEETETVYNVDISEQ